VPPESFSVSGRRWRGSSREPHAWKHGAHSAETMALKREIAALARLARKTMATVEPLAG